MTLTRRGYLLVPGALALMAACSGAVGAGAGGGDGAGAANGPATSRGGGAGAGGGTMVATGGRGGTTGTPGGPLADGAGPLPFRRLTREELNFTLRDLLGDTSSPADMLDADATGGSGFSDPGVVGRSDADAFAALASKVAGGAASKLSSILGCDPQTGEDACARTFIRGFGARAYRRPLTDAEAARLLSVYTTGRQQLGYGFNEAARMVVEAMLQSPNFLYHWELAAAPAHGTAPVALDAWALASRLSYFVWRSMPDAALFTAAQQGALATPAAAEAQARRLLKDPRARGAIESFHVQWLGVQSVAQTQLDPKAYPGFSAQAAQAELDELKAFADHAALVDGKWSTLMTAGFSFVNRANAALYGVTGVTAADPAMTALPSAQRKGVLTQLAFLTTYPAGAPTHPPVQRGKRIYNQVLCGAIQPPGMVPPLDPPPPGLPLRQHFQQHSANPACAGCHRILDPIGFAFESYDSAGRWRTTDATGAPVDTSSTVQFPRAGEKPVRGALDLVDAIAASDEAADCFATQWFRYALGRAETDADAASLASSIAAFRAAGTDIRELMVAVARSRAFLNRTPSPGEDTP